MKAYRGIALAIAVLVVLQASFIALGMFQVINDVDEATKSINTDYFREENAGVGLHSIGAMVVSLLAIVLLITSLFAKTVGASKRALMVFGAVVLQWVLAIVSFGAPAVGPLHGINAFVILGSALYASRLASVPTTLSAPRESSAV